MVYGIKKRNGKVLDRCTGLSKATVAVAVKGLEDKGIIEVKRNTSKRKGYEPTTYSLLFEGKEPLSKNQTRGGPKNGQGLVQKSDIQETVLQQTDIQNRYSSKNARNGSNHDKGNHETLAIGDILKSKIKPKETPQVQVTVPDSIKVTMQEISQEFGDRRNTHANITRVMNLVQKSGKDPDSIYHLLYEARSITKQQGSVRRKMPYFFEVLKDRIGLQTSMAY
jgi:DNA-binding transcriptional regulator GbsR (MarR family)